MKKIIALAICLGLFSFGNAQTSGQVATYTPGVGAPTDGLYNYAMGSISDKQQKLQYDDDSIEGSPYLSNSFEKSQIHYGDELVGDIYYRYNAYNEEIEVKQQNLDSEPIRGLSKDKKISISINGYPVSFKTFIDKNGTTQNGYLMLLQDGKYKLYKHYDVTFKEAKKAETSLTKDLPARFTKYTEYYIESEDGKRISQVQLSNKKILDVVSDSEKNELKEFLKDKKLKIKTEENLKSVISFLNS